MKRWLCFSAALLCLTGCASYDIADNLSSTRGGEPTETFGYEGPIVLGNKVNVPYSIDNMRLAYAQIQGTFADVEGTELQPNALYVRFLPADLDEYLYLSEGLNLNLFDHPLDYEIESPGSYYHDPSLPEGNITWQYTTVSPDFDFPEGIVYEILEEAYIPELAEDTGGGTRSGGSSFEAELERVAFELCGYGDLIGGGDSEVGTRGIFDKAVNPVGTYRIWDNSAQEFRPLAGVKVSVRWLFNVSSTHTAADGSYRIPRAYQCNPLYTLTFTNNIRPFQIYGNLGPVTPAFHGMDKQSRHGHSVDFTGGNAWVWGTVNYCTMQYWDKCDTGLIPNAPPSDLRIWVLKSYSSSSAPMLRRIKGKFSANMSEFSGWMSGYLKVNVSNFKDIMPDITIGTSGATTRGIYYLCHHELAHASHFQQAGADYWARYVKYILNCFNKGLPTYGNATLSDSGICAVGENWGYAIGKVYEYIEYEATGLLNTTGTPRAYPSASNWFRPEINWDLIAQGILTPARIYACMTPAVTTLEQFRVQLVARNPSLTERINAVFRAHGFPPVTTTPPPANPPPTNRPVDMSDITPISIDGLESPVKRIDSLITAQPIARDSTGVFAAEGSH